MNKARRKLYRQKIGYNKLKDSTIHIAEGFYFYTIRTEKSKELIHQDKLVIIE
jgi:hypothetical protein